MTCCDDDALEEFDYGVIRGHFAYESFRLAARGYELVTGPLVSWGDLPEETRRAWVQTAADVCERFGGG